MSNILRRPMFRRGGAVNSSGTGITSGLDTPKRGLVDEPGKYSQRLNEPSIDQAISMYSDVAKAMPFDYKPELSLGDYLKIASRGAEIVGAPSEGSGFGGVLATASKPLAKLGMELGTGIDKRQALAKKTYQDRVGAVAKLAGDIEREKIKATKEGVIAQNLRLFNENQDARIAKATQERDQYPKGSEEYIRADNILKSIEAFKADGQTAILTKSQPQYAEMRKIFLEFIKQSDGDIDAAIQSFTRYFPKAEMESIFPGFSIEAVTSGSEQKKKPKIYAQGGRAGYNTGMLVEEEQDMVEEEPVKQAEKQQAMPLTYDQLRARLPQSIGDDIVRLLADNYDALGDFAAIQTQADVDNFNLKYQVNLVLPQEA